MGYTESFYALSHGTDEQSAENILSTGFRVQGDVTSWCGKGVYFYDTKSKAWWAAERKCREKKLEKVKPAIVLADIKDIKKSDIFDLRVKKDLEEFENAISHMLDAYRLEVQEIEDETERIIILRSLLISFHADIIKKSKMVIGHFRQRPQPLYEHVVEFADSLDIVFGIETIYCVKDTGVICNIRKGASCIMQI